ncbi:MAG: peptidylprolyl isomerase [Thermoprotei archaeon]|nr:MAG: peptidylprolyl isomerase [Thermoprotei archaeon]
MPVERNDYVLLEYTTEIKEDGRVIDTTIEEVARKHRIYKEDKVYGPRLIIIGEGMLIKYVEDNIVGMEEGEEKVIEVPPEKGFGLRDPKKIRVIPAVELSRRGIIPKVDMQVEIDGRVAVIRSVGSGRVQLDFNHPLAGKTLVYRVKVVKILKDKESKVKELTRRWLPTLKPEEIDVKTPEEGILEISLPPRTLLMEGIGVRKRSIAMDLGKRFDDLREIRFIDVIKLKEKEEKEEKSESKT